MRILLIEDDAKMLDGKFPEYREGFDGIRVTAMTTQPEDSFKSFHVIIPFEEL